MDISSKNIFGTQLMITSDRKQCDSDLPHQQENEVSHLHSKRQCNAASTLFIGGIMWVQIFLCTKERISLF